MPYPTSNLDYSGGTANAGSTYTQTYSTADRTHGTPTAAAVVTTAATSSTPFGYAEAQANAIVTAINALRADHLDLAQLVNAIIDDLQSRSIIQ